MTQVVIDDIIPRTQLISAASQTVFNTNWTADEGTDVNVYARASGVEPDDITQLVSPSLYNVTFVGGSQAVRVTFLSGRALNDVITIVRNTPAERTNLYINTNFVPSMLNQDFGILTLVDQQAQMYDTVVNPGYNVSATIDQKDKVLPILGAQQAWRMNEDNTAIEAYTIDNAPAPTDAPFLTYADDDTLENPQNLGLLTDGILKQTVTLGVATLAIAIPGVDYLDPGMPLGTMAYQDANNVNISAGVGNFTSGTIASSPTLSTDLVNKAYADSIAAGFSFKASCLVASTTNLNATYANGASGVGATLTEVGNGTLSLDGVAPGMGTRVLIKDQSTTSRNGVYTVTNTGSAGSQYVLTRATDFDTAVEIQPGSIIFIQSGTLYSDTSFVETEPVFTVGTDPILFTQFSQTYPLSMGSGGTGSVITPIANGVFSSSAGSVGQLSTTLPAGLTIPGYAHSGANADITSMTGLTGVLRAPTAIASSAGLNVLAFTYAATAVNYTQLSNSATGIPVGLVAAGTDANIQYNLASKGTAQVIVLGALGATSPFALYNGTAYQHGTNFIMPNTAATRNVTFQDSDGTMAYLADRGMVLLATANASASASIAFTGLTGYSNYMAIFNCLTPATNGALLYFQGSIDNGVNWLFTPPAYYQQSLFYTNTTIAANQDITTLVAGVMSSGNLNSVPGPSGTIMFENLGGATRKGYNGTTQYVNSGASVIAGLVYNGWFANTNPINAIRFIMSAGNITSGTIQFYGIK